MRLSSGGGDRVHRAAAAAEPRVRRRRPRAEAGIRGLAGDGIDVAAFGDQDIDFAQVIDAQKDLHGGGVGNEDLIVGIEARLVALGLEHADDLEVQCP